MTETVEKVRETSSQDGNVVQKTTEIDDPKSEQTHSINVAERVIWFVAGVLLAILGLRFLLSLLGANPTNSFANLIYNLSHPFVSPFFSLFNYNTLTNGASHFELYTLVAMLFYALVAVGLARLVTLSRD